MDAIKIEVMRSDGSSEMLTIVGPVRISGQCLISGTGTEHFFTSEGRYDGWGMPFTAEVSEGENPLDCVMPFIDAVEADREIIP